MGSELINISYKGESGESKIRTVQVGEIVHVSLVDVVKTLSKENEELGEQNRQAAIPSIIRTVSSTLDKDEYIERPVENARYDNETELFVTHPGLYRIISVDKSKASRKFQKWLFHDVVPSIVKFGTYPAPENTGSSLSQMAELLAQNSRLLADTITRQDKLEDEVNTKFGALDDRVKQIESYGEDTSQYLTVGERLDELDITFDEKAREEIVAWCENITINSDYKRIKCPSNNRFNAKFAISVIDGAISNVKKLAAHRANK
ncbi:BRO family protein [Aestuariibacter sp. AA17]|uniref:BRO family protein n=1 Tax=Fluctibacter corallii TaxID=2984329 RepID=A0ABT3AA35_9ALTE|nr:BRO family protein [Aestuariibacter sp. AA17]MCV2885540.1 BRO family protein [Aestuariibacter sp. AA17]